MPTTIHSLPFEILSCIFAQYHDNTDEEVDEDQIITDSAPLLLGRVCSRWRGVAAQTRQLWNGIWVKSSHQLDIFDLTFARTHLSRCGPSLPLTLHIFWGEFGAEFHEEERSAFDELVLHPATRWEIVDLKLFVADGILGFLKKIQAFTSLTTLKFSFPSTCSRPEEFDVIYVRELCIGAARLPSLLHLSLDLRGCIGPHPAAIPFIQTLTLPSLSTFNLLLNEGTILTVSDGIWDVFTDMLERSNRPPLKVINTSLKSNPNGDIACYLLEQTPYLEVAHGLYLDDEAFSALTGEVEEPHAPNLKEVNLEHVPRDQNVDSTIRVLAARCAGGTGPLKRVNLLETQEDPIGQAKFLWKLWSNLKGVKVCVHRRG